MGNVTVYFPDDVEKKIRKLAKEEKRSLSSQVVFMVTKCMKKS